MEKVQQVHKQTEADNDGRTVIHWSPLEYANQTQISARGS